jgi:hypothetical protein
MQQILEYRGIAENFLKMSKEQVETLNQRSIQWSNVLNEMSKKLLPLD